MEWAQYLDKLACRRTIQLGRLGWIADYPIIDNFLFPLFHDRERSTTFVLFQRACSRRQAHRDARKTIDTDDRIAKYQAIEKTIGDAMLRSSRSSSTAHMPSVPTGSTTSSTAR